MKERHKMTGKCEGVIDIFLQGGWLRYGRTQPPTHTRTRAQTQTHQQICRLSLRRPQFHSRKFYIRFAKDKLALGWVLFSTVRFIPLIWQFIFIYHWRLLELASSP